ncbi:bifunctional alpha,alpha-trehalose-phosphate synthase (UDP-forming)/trehalose-phosphatase [Flammeovirga yaeyamensis]|uniref:Alpha,alpha-trehalose-phosphate synthase n=1 Tax=Flammeovirga yaeyamensis TaxID=367791 RepID=A0AAX1N3X6_9BACT|nr:bifunctional alpha,alpha-trehalose-phosphate synthase (UDP-forming)/trehalose-phosphatase [Flammeovirga yaeyamensis]MBB3699733.1 trehalose 6-phosphate synthase/phosphatase [Flammeovirga yaeyamensis]NMF36697.1 bifunctional alpha,alpha-trehalose-phosphate synthase (UDP-forming)/trehalose-phosphatase [Flammeovirga yaeyamensis]QWG02259.1 bifunctional alpha,alpha-trehalose-phosphate synthase (UDP-forming)/trehalose-phosphatase [Flammeovirga yaeyamensis]
MSKKTIIVSNRLPVTVSRNADKGITFKPSSGGLATGLSTTYKQGGNLWIGWPGTSDHDQAEKDHITSELKKDNMAPVFLTSEDVNKFYEGYSNKTLWPLFHYFTEYATYEMDLWESYIHVNELFRDAILEVAEPEDKIWVHDYQLLLLPGMLREALPNATIGFFQHIPFPSYEIFRLLPWRQETLEGVLGADLIGFHTYDDMRHFLSSVNRIVGYDSSLGHIKVKNRLVSVDAFPMGIDYDKFESAADSEKTKQKVIAYGDLLSKNKSILSIDRLDYSKGIKHRLIAFDKFLSKYPEYQGQVSLILLVVPSRDKVDQYQHLKEEIDTLVGKVNGKYSRMNWSPIHYFYRSFSFEGLSALYKASSVALVTPLRDGMNLVCKEFVASKTDQQGVLILSEMAGAAKELSEAILINPNDENQIVEALYTSLTMPEEEQRSRMKEMQKKVRRYNVHRWVEIFMNQLDNIIERQTAMNMRLLSEKSRAKMLQKYTDGQKRIIFLDYDGTLKGFAADPQSVSPDQELRDIMFNLTADPKNRVVIISGRDKETLETWFTDFKVDIIAEHGIWLRSGDEPFQMIDNLNSDWKGKINGILDRYVDRTPGSFVEEKAYSVAWHYRKADADFGDLRARELVGNLNYLISNMNLQVMHGNKVVEVKNQDVNKGKAALKFLSEDKYDIVLAIGDDVTDEDTFRAMPKKAYTIKVGMSASEARYNLKTVADVRELLTEFTKIK